MKNNIKIIEDNAGQFYIQNTETKKVCFYTDFEIAYIDIQLILAGDGMANWEYSEDELYITDELYAEHQFSGGYKIHTKESLRYLINKFKNQE